MGERRYRQGCRSGHLAALGIIVSSLDDKLGIRRVLVTSVLVVFVTAGCGATPAPSAFEALPQQTTTTETTAPLPATTAPAPRTTVPAPTATVPAPKKATTGVPAAPVPHPSRPAPVQGSDPVVWAGAFCSGFGDVNAAASGIEQSVPTPQDTKDAMLQSLDTAQQSLTNAAHKLTQLGPPGTTGGNQAQASAVGFLTTVAGKVGDQRAKLAALDANNPDFERNASQLISPGLGEFIQPQGVTNSQELVRAFLAAPECQRLDAPATNLAPGPPSPLAH